MGYDLHLPSLNLVFYAEVSVGKVIRTKQSFLFLGLRSLVMPEHSSPGSLYRLKQTATHVETFHFLITALVQIAFH